MATKKNPTAKPKATSRGAAIAKHKAAGKDSWSALFAKLDSSPKTRKGKR